MNNGWEPDEVISVVDNIKQIFGEPGLKAIEDALNQSAFNWGKELAQMDNNDISPIGFVSHFTQNPKEPIRIIEQGPDFAVIETTKCRPCEIFRELNRSDVGYRFKCMQDYSIIRGYDVSITLQVEQVMMNGGTICIHRYTKTPKKIK